MKNQFKFLGIIALIAAVVGFLMTACPDSNDDGGSGNGISIGQLPEFPSGSNPVTIKTDAEIILAELRKSPILDYINEEIWEVIDEYSPRRGNYSFSNRSLPDGFVKVSASGTENETNTGGFKTLSDNRKSLHELYDAIDELYEISPVDYEKIHDLNDEIYRLEDERYDIQFTIGNKTNGTWNESQKGELIKAKTEGGVTIAQNSIFEGKYNYSENYTVTEAGPYTVFRVNCTGSEKGKIIFAFTVTTPSGSIKIILDVNTEWSYTGTNVTYRDGDDDLGIYTETAKYSGSLKVYGSNNALLIDHRIVDEESFTMAQYMISYDPYSFNPADATPLTSNVKINGNISSQGTAALYSINVTSGTKYHVWWDDSDTNRDNLDVKVRGYYSNGSVFFDMDGDWNLDWVNYYSFTAASTGTVYIMVYPNSEYETGTFAIVYNTTGSQPAMSVSFMDPLSANSRNVQTNADSAVIPKKAVEVLRHHK